MAERATWFAIKAEIRDIDAVVLELIAQKTMYGGRRIMVGDSVFLFASENEGGKGLLARAVVTECAAVPPTSAARQTPRVSITVRRDRTADAALGRDELKAHRGHGMATPEGELDFKLYRQATNKIVGLTDEAGAYLNALVQSGSTTAT